MSPKDHLHDQGIDLNSVPHGLGTGKQGNVYPGTGEKIGAFLGNGKYNTSKNYRNFQIF